MSGESKPSLVSLREHRDQTIALLSEHFARDHLSMEEYEERVDRAHCATTIAALDELLGDLVAIGPSSMALTVRDSTALDATRPDHKSVIAVMGGVDLDFREAFIQPGVTEVKVRAIMGGIDIIVPPNVAVEAEGLAIMGGFEEMHRAPPMPDPDRPLLRISGLALMGGFDIETRLPGESWWQARKRARKERKALRDRHHDHKRLRKAERKRLRGGKSDHDHDADDD